MDSNNNRLNDVESIHGKAKNAVNQGFFEALNVVAAVEVPPSVSNGSSSESGFQKGMQHPVHTSNKLSKKKRKGSTEMSPSLPNGTKQLSKGETIDTTFTYEGFPLTILDGQHRIAGLYMALEEIDSVMESTRQASSLSVLPQTDFLKHRNSSRKIGQVQNKRALSQYNSIKTTLERRTK